MKLPVHDITLSSSIMNVTGRILPFTALGASMPSDTAHDIVIELAHLLKLASSMERELSVHRLSEAGILARGVLEGKASAAFEHLSRDPKGTVVKVDFDGGRKK